MTATRIGLAPAILTPAIIAATAAVLLALAVFPSNASAQPGQQDNPLSFDRNIRGLLNRYCYRCHNADEPNGGIDLNSARDPRMIANDPETWRTALAQVRDETMPPDDARQPSDHERKLIGDFIEMTVSEFDCDAPRDPGTPTLRRLNRAEYDRSIEFLTGLDLGLADSFPEDAISFGFRNIARSLTLTPLQVEQYHQAARRAIDAVLESKESAPEIYRNVFFVTADDNETHAAKRIIRRFATRAFRRDVDDVQLDRLLSLYETLRKRDIGHEPATGHVLTAILISPRFLMRTEQQRPDHDGPYPVDDFDLASRLSFFLWSAPPDKTLLRLARHGKLGNEKELDRQVTRMLADTRSDALIDQFFEPWLQLDRLASHRPDQNVFPNVDQPLLASIAEEPRRFLAHLIRNDRPVRELIDAGYLFVDDRLANHYSIDDVHGPEFRRIELPDRRRGGLLTSAAVLMSQSDPGRTNLPRRGNFIAGAILGSAPPPPPPDVPELNDDDPAAETQTLRERFEAHRADPQCRSCHSKIDPLGFALENFDAVGRWRDREVGQPIDASGTLPDGRQFEGPVGLKDVLLQDQEAFVRVMTRQLLTFALGRGPIRGDQCVIDDVVEATEKDGDNFSVLVREIVHSYPFRYTRNPEF